ncbi:MAG: hypothetical protein HQM08_04220 [Candidatus Riflebacteria bacterium]|nr:hypothetical protein [Candidatus Riflebacteria bacterium]
MSSINKNLHILATSREAMTMLELLLGIVIFSFAMLPLLWMGASTGKAAYSVGKHMMAGQIAAGQIDRLLSLPYEDCKKKIEETPGEKSVMDDPLFTQILSHPTFSASNEMRNDLEKSFKNFKFEWSKKEASGQEQGTMFEIAVKISWLVDEGDLNSRQSIVLRTIKYKELQ